MRLQFRLAMLGAILLVGALLLLVFMTLFPFVTLTYGDVPSYLEVNKRPEAHLYYPGSRVLEVDISGESRALEGGPIPAHASALIATSSSSTSHSQVLAWYRDYLTRHGWSEVAAGHFRRASEVFQVDPSNSGQYRVIYAARPCRLGGTFCLAI